MTLLTRQQRLITTIVELHKLGCSPQLISELMDAAKKLSVLHERQCLALDKHQMLITSANITRTFNKVNCKVSGLPFVLHRQSDPRGMPLYAVPYTLITKITPIESIYDKGVCIYYK